MPKSFSTRILAAVDYYSPERIVDEFTQVTGKTARFVQIGEETYKGFLPAQMAKEMLENHLLMDGPGYYGGQSLHESVTLVEEAGLKLTTWKDFLARNTASF